MSCHNDYYEEDNVDRTIRLVEKLIVWFVIGIVFTLMFFFVMVEPLGATETPLREAVPTIDYKRERKEYRL